ncbi:MAG: tetrahydromethanopterin S-methyltransferase subunit H [archaeon]|nr:tetrahydromethanopterin S-methyltransferase subunit H [archaeon]
MYETDDGQKIAEFDKLKIGGEKGENPIVLVGSIFYTGHNVVKDEKKGEFDKEQVEKELNEFLEFSDKTGIPVIIDVVGSYKEPLAKWCEFIANNTDVPFLVDGMSSGSRIYAMKQLIEIGLKERAIYNSIDVHTTDDDLIQIKELGVKNAILLTFGSGAVTPKKKGELLMGKLGKKVGLVEKAEKAGIKDYMVDVAVLDVPSIAIAAGTIRKFKEEYKIPCGCAPINALAEWDNNKLFGKTGSIANSASITTYIAEAGANFIMYGSIRAANRVFPGIAMINSVNGYYRKRILKKNYNPIKFVEFLR